MQLKDYLSRRKQLRDQEDAPRASCNICLCSRSACYCSKLSAFDPKIQFCILIHPLEAKRRIATGRMSHLTLENSKLIRGEDFSKNSIVNQVISDPNYKSFILYPGAKAKNLSMMSVKDLKLSFGSQPGKRLTVFVIDGTWKTARKMLRLSKNLETLPRICFSPPALSRFRVRKQPRPEFYSTIEAIHHCIELLGPHCEFDTSSRKHDALIEVFDHMVEKQLKFVPKSLSKVHLRSRLLGPAKQ